MGYYYHKKKRRKLKYVEKKILYLIIPLSFIIALGTQIVVKGIPRWFYIMIGNMRNIRMEETISRALVKDYTVQRETKLQKDYEKSYRENQADSYVDDHIDLLENKRDEEIEEYEKYFEKEKKGK